MANVGVTFDFSAESAKLRSEIDKVRKEVSGLNSTVKGIADGFKALGGTILGALSLGALTSQLTAAGKAAIQFGDDMQKAAARTGIGAGQFALFADAAKMADIDVGVLSKSLQKMQVAISEAGSGSKAQLQTFRALGIEFEELRRLAPEDQFLRIADQISRIQSPADKVRASVELFGKSGADLLPFFEQGAAGIRKATDEIVRMGGALSDEQIQKLADADTAVKRLSQSWTNFARELTASVAPAITAVLDHLANADTSKIDAARASQIKALLDSRGPTADLFQDTKALRAELEAIEERMVAIARQRRLLAVSRGGGSDVLPGAPPGFEAPPSKGPKTSATKKEDDVPSIYDAFKATSLIESDPLSQPEYLLQQSLGTAMLELRTTQAAEQLALGEQTNQSWLASLFASNEMAIAAEQAKNATLGQSMGELVGMAMQQGGALGKYAKGYHIAQTIWATADAIMQVMSSKGPGWPANIGVAAMIAAKGAMQLANIKKTNIGSSGSIAGAGGGGSVGGSSALQDTSASSAQGAQPLQQQSAVQIIVQGSLFAAQETVDWLTEKIGEAVNGRDVVFIQPASRQASEIRG